MATIRYKKRGNKFYAYELHQYWDKELKKPRQKTKYLGVSETKGGLYQKTGRVPAPKIEKQIVDYGDTFAVTEVAKSIGLPDLIEKSFNHVDSIMTLLCFQILEGSAMYNCEDWVNGNIAKIIFPNSKISSQNISQILKTLGRQDLQNVFFKSYVQKFFPKKTGLLIDSTALSSAINTSINAFGYAGGQIDQNITCLMLVDKHSKLPIYFRPVGGDIADISTLKTSMAEIKKLGLSADSAVLDAGFCSKENLQFLCTENIDFMTRLPKSHKVFSQIVHTAGTIENSAHAVQYGDRIVFVKSVQKDLYGHPMYAHIVFDPSKKSKDIHQILKDNLDENLTPEEQKKLDDKMTMAGFFILLSKNAIDKKDILPGYYTRQTIEQIFGFSKHNNNILPLRVHDEQAIRGFLMLVFLSLIIFVTMRQRLKNPMDKSFLILRSLKAKIFDETPIPQEPSKKVKLLFKQLNIIMPT